MYKTFTEKIICKFKILISSIDLQLKFRLTLRYTVYNYIIIFLIFFTPMYVCNSCTVRNRRKTKILLVCIR